ncbi:hypothetical protein ST47_g5381 [Ascochyta rabiei]|uniref:Uncharacterized protein n=1 Tax=Didymella rabiei TaxID=5454 RepID=A0A163E2C1_DIDRA|nr:hypothetical protein ST47_g5381 [Ascochyta rabiei]
MSSIYFGFPQCYDSQPVSSVMQKATAFDQIQHMLANLAISNYGEPNIYNPHTDTLHEANSKPAYERSPCTPTKSFPHPSTSGYTELDTTINTTTHHRLPTPATPVPSHAPWTRDLKELADPLTYEELSHLAHLKTARHESAFTLMQARREVEIETEKLNRLDAEVSAMQCGRRC